MRGESTAPMVADQLSEEEQRSFAPRDCDYWVEVVRGPDLGSTAKLETELVAGTASGFTLTDETVSRRHFKLTRADEGVWLEDLGSRNGTTLSGVRVERVLVRREAWFHAGSTLLRLAAVPRVPTEDERGFGCLIGSSPKMESLFALLRRASRTISTVLLLGETGTGKEVIARALHQQSPRRHRPFVVVDCGALAQGLTSSQLFGHVKGSFTGAVADRAGAFVTAHRGTVFLDEIGDLPLDAQPQLLRALENRTVRPVGGAEDVPVDVRVVAATHRDLAADVKAGRFREDLYFRLNVIRVEVPPLRERPGDLEALVHGFLAASGRADFSLSPVLLEKLRGYHWPGNVRELRNLIERALAGAELELSAPQPAFEARIDQPFKEAKEALLDAFSRDYFTRLFEQHRGNVTEVAKAAGIARTYAHEVLKKLGLKPI